MEPQRTTLSETPFEKIFWLDAAERSTVQVAGDYVKEWASKSGDSSARSESFSALAGLQPQADAPVGSWRNAVVSRDGRIVLVFSELGGPTYISDDRGVHFREIPEMSGAVLQVYMEAVISGDGSTIAVCLFDGPLMISRDAGMTWTQFDMAPMRLWEWCGVSDDGRYLLASAQGDGIFQSRDGGVTWDMLGLPPGQNELGFVYVSPTGENQYIAYYDGPLSLSSNRGKTFLDHPRMLRGNWGDIAVQKDPTGTPLHQLIYETPGSVWVSNDAAGTWERRLGDRARRYAAAAVSGSGSVMVVAEEDGSVFFSSDFGKTFAEVTSLGSGPWSAVHACIDGTVIVGGNGTPLYETNDGGLTWTEGPTFTLTQDVSLSGLGSSWDGRVTVVAPGDGAVQVTAASTEPRFTTGAVSFRGSVMTVTGPNLGSSFTLFFAATLRDPSRTSGPLFSLGYTALRPLGMFGQTEVVLSEDILRAKAPAWVKKGPFILALVVTPEGFSVHVNNVQVFNEPLGPVVGNGPLRIGGDEAGATFDGDIGEVLVFNGSVFSDGAAWAAVMYYLGRKWRVPAAIPYLPGIGSDPHIKTLTGGSFDVVKPGMYDLFRCTPGFVVRAKISPLKTGLFIEHVLVENGSTSVKVMMKTRTLKWTGRQGESLCLNTACPVKWDVYPQSPARMVKVVSGHHEIIGAFHIRFDFQLRYVTPHFPTFQSWEKADGILVRGTGAGRGVRKTTFKGLIRPGSG